jgi:hypothetical protein
VKRMRKPPFRGGFILPFAYETCRSNFFCNHLCGNEISALLHLPRNARNSLRAHFIRLLWLYRLFQMSYLSVDMPNISVNTQENLTAIITRLHTFTRQESAQFPAVSAPRRSPDTIAFSFSDSVCQAVRRSHLRDDFSIYRVPGKTAFRAYTFCIT